MTRFKLRPPLFLLLLDICGFGSFLLLTGDSTVRKDALISALVFFCALMLIYILMTAFKLGDG